MSSISFENSPSLEGAHVNGRYDYYPMWRIGISGGALAEEYEHFDLTPEQVRQAVEDAEDDIIAAIAKVLCRHLADEHESKRRYRDRVTASVDRQVRTERDYLHDVDTIEFDCSLALDNIDLRYLPPVYDGFEDGWCDYGVDVFEESENLGLTDDWDGPFKFYIAHEDEYDRYIAKRVKREYGYELR